MLVSVPLLGVALALTAQPSPEGAGGPGPPLAAALTARAHALQLAERREWQVLLHTTPDLFGGVTSSIDAPGFFFSPHGKDDPAAELDATLAAFFAVPAGWTGPDHPLCAYPARAAWLRAELGIDAAQLPAPPCDRYAQWRQTIGARSITLVFASAFLNNPASMFGHPFLRLNRATRGLGSDLLAYSVNFAAEPTTNNAILYTFMGLLGGFPGTFTTLPYYLKVKEYGALESRDLWEYELSFTAPEIERFMQHLWELGRATFDYYYLDENCSYHLLGVLEVARPSLRLTHRFAAWVVPTDTLRLLSEQPGLIGEVRYRPSRQAVMRARRALLEGDEKALAAALAESIEPESVALLEALPPARQARVLDAAAELLRYRAGSRETLEPPEQEVERALFLRRGRLGMASPPLDIARGDPPDTGHGSTALALGGGWDGVDPFVALTVRPALHTVLDAQDGFAANTQIEFITGELRARPTSGLVLEQLDLLRIQSISPLDPWTPSPSWRLNIGAARSRELRCVEWDCVYGSFSGGPGVAASFDLGIGELVPYLFVDADLRVGPVYRDDYRISAGATVGLLAQLGPYARLHVDASYLYPFLGVERPSWRPGPDDGPDFRVSGALGVKLGRDLQLRVPAVVGRGYHEVGAGLWLYW